MVIHTELVCPPPAVLLSLSLSYTNEPLMASSKMNLPKTRIWGFILSAQHTETFRLFVTFERKWFILLFKVCFLHICHCAVNTSTHMFVDSRFCRYIYSWCTVCIVIMINCLIPLVMLGCKVASQLQQLQSFPLLLTLACKFTRQEVYTLDPIDWIIPLMPLWVL